MITDAQPYNILLNRRPQIRICSGNSSDLVTGEDADAVSVQDIPEPDGAIRRPCGDIIGVGVEAGASDIS